MKRIIAFVIKRQDAILNTVFVTGLSLLIWVAIRVLTAPGAPCFGF
nr:MAG TPA: PTU-1 channel, assassin bug, TOXIN [Bacteriophage sp.]